ncbi:hypothetical protein CYMTET_32121 [Cymbomonas tetramitiformis]|uniref:Uncharacterized protein n=1 Tax=Cymbomonas tetramitiformis TaxID=36881 RepID=A0AAE0FG97_9CHLO|nr:hypothetical protein CYMTET_32121 [Cymbomonas tetramitiformis]
MECGLNGLAGVCWFYGSQGREEEETIDRRRPFETALSLRSLTRRSQRAGMKMQHMRFWGRSSSLFKSFKSDEVVYSFGDPEESSPPSSESEKVTSPDAAEDYVEEGVNTTADEKRILDSSSSWPVEWPAWANFLKMLHEKGLFGDVRWDGQGICREGLIRELGDGGVTKRALLSFSRSREHLISGVPEELAKNLALIPCPDTVRPGTGRKLINGVKRLRASYGDQPSYRPPVPGTGLS